MYDDRINGIPDFEEWLEWLKSSHDVHDLIDLIEVDVDELVDALHHLFYEKYREIPDMDEEEEGMDDGLRIVTEEELFGE